MQQEVEGRINRNGLNRCAGTSVRRKRIERKRGGGGKEKKMTRSFRERR